MFRRIQGNQPCRQSRDALILPRESTVQPLFAAQSTVVQTEPRLVQIDRNDKKPATRLRTKHPGTVMRILRLLELLNSLVHLGKMNVGVFVVSHMDDFAIQPDQKADSPSTVVRSRAGPV